MQRVVIDIPDNIISFFMELVNNLGFKKVKMISKEQKQFVDDLQHSLEQVNSIRKEKYNSNQQGIFSMSFNVVVTEGFKKHAKGIAKKHRFLFFSSLF